jgi:hypothetical protein
LTAVLGIHTRSLVHAGLAFPMIDINLCMEILELKDKFVGFDVGLTNEEIEQRMEAHMDDIFNVFHDKEKVHFGQALAQHEFSSRSFSRANALTLSCSIA